MKDNPHEYPPYEFPMTKMTRPAGNDDDESDVHASNLSIADRRLLSQAPGSTCSNVILPSGLYIRQAATWERLLREVQEMQQALASQPARKWHHLAEMLAAAMFLTVTSEQNTEYVRGQVNLIQDTSRLGLGGEAAHDVLAAIITGKTSLGLGLADLADLVASGEARA